MKIEIFSSKDEKKFYTLSLPPVSRLCTLWCKILKLSYSAAIQSKHLQYINIVWVLYFFYTCHLSSNLLTASDPLRLEFIATEFLSSLATGECAFKTGTGSESSKRPEPLLLCNFGLRLKSCCVALWRRCILALCRTLSAMLKQSRRLLRESWRFNMSILVNES